MVTSVLMATASTPAKYYALQKHRIALNASLSKMMYTNADETKEGDDDLDSQVAPVQAPAEGSTADSGNRLAPLLPIIKHRDAAGFPADTGKPPAPTSEPDEELYATVQEKPVPKERCKKPAELPSIERRNWLIHDHFIRQEWDACKALIKEQSDESNGTCEYASYIKGVILRQEGKLQESLDMFQACAMLNPKNGLYLKQIARSLFLMGKTAAALNVFDESLKLAVDDWEAYHWKGVCLYHTGEYQKARDTLKQAITLSKHEETFILLGKIFERENDFMNAIDAYRRALELSPENPDILTKLGLLYLKTGSDQPAFESLGRALAFDPSHAGAIIAAGSMMQEHGDYDVALTKYRVAAAQWPDSPQLWSNIAMCFFGKKKYVAAVSCLKRANYLAPFDWKILYNLGVVELQMQQYASSFHFLSSAINLNPKVAILYMTLAVVLTSLDDYDNARRAYEHAAKLDQRDPIIAFNFAVFCYKREDLANASHWLSVYHQRLPHVRDSKTGVIKLEREIIDMAEKLTEMLQQGRRRSIVDSTAREDARPNGPATNVADETADV